MRTKERQLLGSSTSTMPCSGVWYRSAQKAVAAVEGGRGGGGGSREAEGKYFPGPGANKQCLDYRYLGEGRIASVFRSRW